MVPILHTPLEIHGSVTNFVVSSEGGKSQVINLKEGGGLAWWPHAFDGGFFRAVSSIFVSWCSFTMVTLA